MLHAALLVVLLPAPLPQAVTPRVMTRPAPKTRPAPQSQRPAVVERGPTMKPPRKKLKVLVIPMDTPEEARRKRVLAQCQREGGQWYIKVRGLRISALGSDVDEIYGRIFVISDSAARDPNDMNGRSMIRSSHLGGGWQRDDLWYADKSVDLGKSPQTNLATLMITNEGWRTGQRSVDIHFNVRDEDGGRGGSDDEFFYLHPGSTVFSNKHRVPLEIPTCQEGAEFSRETQFIISGSPHQSASGNKVSLHVNVRAFRIYD